MDQYVEILSNIFIPSETEWRVDFVAIREGEVIRPGAHLGLLENQRGSGASLAAQYGGEVVKVLIREGQRFLSDTPIALIKLNIWESSGVIIGANQRRIFLVHGHGHLVNRSVELFLLGHQMKTIVLNQEPGKGRTIIEKFEQSADVGFAVVVLTPDDLGADQASATAGQLLPRARQNVILELGYFIARLGRNRVCAIKCGNVELPSDIIGVSYVDFDESGTWQSRVTRELAAAGYPVDLSKMTAEGT